VAGGAILLVVAAVALLLVVLGLDRMNADEVTAMALWMRVTTKVLFIEIGAVQQSPLMAIQTPGLIVALVTVIADLGRQQPVTMYKISIVVGRNPFALMTGVALTNLHFGVFSVGLFFLGVGLLL
jgi:hypothetical protein